MVGDSNDDDHLGINPVHQIEGKSMQRNAARLTLHRLADSRMFMQKTERMLDCGCEFPADVCLGMNGVVIQRLIEFRFS